MRLLICIMLFAGAIACKNKSNQDSVAIARELNKDKADTGRNIQMNEDTVSATMAVKKAEADFAVEATNDNLIEIQLSALAQTKSVNTRVKNFANMLIADHTKINEELQHIATAKNITLPQALSREAKNDIDKLNKREGANFDRGYMNMMLADHRRAMDRFEKAAKDLKDPELKNFIEHSLTFMKKHRDSAAAIVKSFPAGEGIKEVHYP